MANKTGIVILAAGSSSRLGQPKQLLAYKNSTLLKNTIEASSIENTFIIVVTGSNKDLIENELKASEIKISHNPDWESGMSSSIKKGLADLVAFYPECESCIFAVCDQPYVTQTIFENLISEYQKTGKGIVASSYSETLGTPVLFDKKYFNELLALKGQEGAKKIITRFSEDVVAIQFEKGNIDIDTIEDYFLLRDKDF